MALNKDPGATTEHKDESSASMKTDNEAKTDDAASSHESGSEKPRSANQESDREKLTNASQAEIASSESVSAILDYEVHEEKSGTKRARQLSHYQLQN